MFNSAAVDVTAVDPKIKSPSGIVTSPVNVGVVSAAVVTVNVSLTPPTVTVAPTAVEKELEDNTLTCKYCPFVIVLVSLKAFYI